MCQCFSNFDLTLGRTHLQIIEIDNMFLETNYLLEKSQNFWIIIVKARVKM